MLCASIIRAYHPQLSCNVQIPKNSPCSVTLQPAPGDTGKPCGVDYELKTYVSEDDEKIHKRFVCFFHVSFVLSTMPFAIITVQFFTYGQWRN